jgi:starch-binding outer membrane protein, SusD/RagB family
MKTIKEKYCSPFVSICICLCITSCKKFVEVAAPITSANADIVYADESQATTVMTAALSLVSGSLTPPDGGFGSISIVGDLSADNMEMIKTTFSNSGTYSQYYKNVVSPGYSMGMQSFWQKLYPIIYVANAAIEGVSKSTTLTKGVKERILGEAYFLRAFSYYYLVSFYGDVPLIVNTDYKISATAARTNTQEVLNQIEFDLKQSVQMLDDRYLYADLRTESTDRVRPNRAAAYALLARVSLTMKKYSDAENAASKVIALSSIYKSDIPLNTVFNKNSMETIWALPSVNLNYNTYDGAIYILDSSGPNSTHPFYLSQGLINSFESGDARKENWIDSAVVGNLVYYYPQKYKVPTGTYSEGDLSEYCVVLRLSEQYLIRAEARIEQNEIDNAKADLNILRSRAGLIDITASTQAELRLAILNEYRLEMFTEWASRWLTLKRTSTLNSVMSLVAPIKDAPAWDETKSFFPIPTEELLYNKNLVQNSGYNN